MSNDSFRTKEIDVVLSLEAIEQFRIMRREQQNGTVRIGDRGSKQTDHRSHKGSIKAGFHFVNDEISPALKGAYSAVNEFGSKNGAVREDIGCDCGVNDPLQGLILKLEVKTWFSAFQLRYSTLGSKVGQWRLAGDMSGSVLLRNPPVRSSFP